MGPSASSSEPARPSVRLAGIPDARAVGVLLDAFNREYHEETPGPDALAARVGELIAGGELTVLCAGAERPDGLAALRFRPSIWSSGVECYLAELYVVPERRGHGIGRALLEAAIDFARSRGADYMDLGTSEDDVAARALYEQLGFSNRENGPDGPVMYVYERKL